MGALCVFCVGAFCGFVLVVADCVVVVLVGCNLSGGGLYLGFASSFWSSDGSFSSLSLFGVHLLLAGFVVFFTRHVILSVN